MFHLKEHRDDVNCGVEKAGLKLFLEIRELFPWLSFVCLEKATMQFWWILILFLITSFVRKMRQERWTANCERTVAIV